MGFEYTSRTTLTDLFGERAQSVTRRALRDMTNAGGARITDLTVAKTPRVTGRLAASWEQTPIRVGQRDGVLVYESGVRSFDPVAAWIERGTAPHRIVSRGRMEFEAPGGERIIVRAVDHPGARGLFVVAGAAALVEAQFEDLARPILRRWARAVEAGS